MTKDSKIWGPNVWHVIHQIVFSLPQNKELSSRIRRVLSNFLKTITRLLPCPICRKHFSYLLSTMSYIKYLKTGKSISSWSVSAHNQVNKRIGKKQISYKTALKLYSKPINSMIFSKFITYVLINSEDQPLARRKLIGACVSLLYPSSKHKVKMEAHLMKYQNLRLIKNKIQFRNWLNSLRKIALLKL